ncbi:MAG: DUF1097 domain-containing protein [Synergistaceae bacterium]|jgi:hypothetical protein|nr:DUF1097 domain-containing protein [Synergistaceae bacterium]
MSYISAVGITVGLLAGAWAYASGLAGVSAFAGFLGWASYFAAGCGKDGATKALCSNLSGVLWGVVFVWLSPFVPAQFGVVIIAILAGIMCWQANFPLLSFIPGTFIGNACFYANGNNWSDTIIGLLCGIALGLASDYLAKYISAGTTKNKS